MNTKVADNFGQFHSSQISSISYPIQLTRPEQAASLNHSIVDLRVLNELPPLVTNKVHLLGGCSCAYLCFYNFKTHERQADIACTATLISFPEFLAMLESNVARDNFAKERDEHEPLEKLCPPSPKLAATAEREPLNRASEPNNLMAP
eukprot:CAMPEP_0169066240 /NCGR_PEP_ID=MMETSP1015-20121227/2847_1 /TAXON_ID=342587 /ORGANISM="Karlodinium micrum, Strain CCMP2283" /LENGTH=147 /DNA_ID=CAMNT_0009124899 /DNA_START=807 /DNA_END=1250 /DNA_ORIENTATION=-